MTLYLYSAVLTGLAIGMLSVIINALIPRVRRWVHQHARENLHTTWMRIYLHLHEGFRTLVHAGAWMLLGILATGHVAQTMINAGTHINRLIDGDVLSKLAHINELTIEQLLALSAVCSTPFVLWSMFWAMHTWRQWIKHAHHSDTRLSAPHETV